MQFFSYLVHHCLLKKGVNSEKNTVYLRKFCGFFANLNWITGAVGSIRKGNKILQHFKI